MSQMGAFHLTDRVFSGAAKGRSLQLGEVDRKRWQAGEREPNTQQSRGFVGSVIVPGSVLPQNNSQMS